jgi:hypothetical protein
MEQITRGKRKYCWNMHVGAGPRARPNVTQHHNVNWVYNPEQEQNNNDSQPIINAWKGRAQRPAPTSQSSMKLKLSNVVGRFKSLTTKYYIDGVKQNNQRPLNNWKMYYYTCIINCEMHNITYYC